MHKPTTYPSIFQLICNCLMKPDQNHYYRVQDLTLENVIFAILKNIDKYLTDKCIKKLRCLSQLFNEVTIDVCMLRNLGFSALKHLRIGYADHKNNQVSYVNLAIAGIIHYSLHPEMLIRYIKGKYIGESRDVAQIIKDVSPHIN